MTRLARVPQAIVGRGAITAFVAACLLTAAVALSGCSSQAPEALGPRISKTATPFVVVTTPAVKDLGLGTALVNEFRGDYPNFDLETTIVATADPVKWAKTKGGDVVIAAQSAAGSRLVADGYASRSLPLMSDGLVVVGPKEDPAAVRKASGVTAALRRIADAASGMSSPGGVPVRFTAVAGDPVTAALWAAAARKPAGAWYTATATGTAQQLKVAAEEMAYAVVEEAAFRGMGGAASGLVVLRRGGDLPTQRYVVVPLSSANDNAVSEAFANWIAKGAGQDVIARWGVTGSGGPLFAPADKSAVLWPSQ